MSELHFKLKISAANIYQEVTAVHTKLAKLGRSLFQLNKAYWSQLPAPKDDQELVGHMMGQLGYPGYSVLPFVVKEYVVNVYIPQMLDPNLKDLDKELFTIRYLAKHELSPTLEGEIGHGCNLYKILFPLPYKSRKLKEIRELSFVGVIPNGFKVKEISIWRYDTEFYITLSDISKE